MKHLLLILIAILLPEWAMSLDAEDDSAAGGFSVPAEFSTQASVWMAWPQYEPIAGHSNIPQVIDIISAITPYEAMDLIINNPSEEMTARAYLKKAHVPTERVRFHTIHHTDFWMRDVGSVFIRNKKGQLAAVDLQFNGWGMGAVSKTFHETSLIDSKIDHAMANALHIPVFTSSLVAEGGAFEFNGNGTLIVSESVILQVQRNPGMTKEMAEAELKRLFGVKKIIWLKQGIVADDSTFYGPLPSPMGSVLTALTTNGHTDEFIRFINDDTVLLAEVTQQEADDAGPHSMVAETRKRLERNREILASEKNQDGKPITIIRIPAAQKMYYQLKPGDSTFDAVVGMVRADIGHKNESVLNPSQKKSATFVSATSYLNYLVTNKVVLMPEYWKPGRSPAIREKDRKAKAILQTAFPHRHIVTIKHVENINISGGGIHCITQQMPQPFL